jgi:hypothetical protein
MKPTRAAPSSALLSFLRAQSNAQTFQAIRCIHHARCSHQQRYASPIAEVPSAKGSQSVLGSSSLLNGANVPIYSGGRRTFVSSAAKRLVGLFGKKNLAACRSTPALPSFLDENEALRRRLRATNEHRLRCTEFDEDGNVTTVNGEFKKGELIQKVVKDYFTGLPCYS